jgi:hypothetical protein
MTSTAHLFCSVFVLQYQCQTGPFSSKIGKRVAIGCEMFVRTSALAFACPSTAKKL